MKILVIGAVVAAGAVLWSQQAPPSFGDAELQAMRDEIARSRHMSLPNLEPPYFVQYLIDSSSNFISINNSSFIQTPKEFSSTASQCD